MKPFSFIHAADLHIDSPLQGVSAESPEVAEQLQKSTYRAFEALIAVCMSREVDFLLVEDLDLLGPLQGTHPAIQRVVVAVNHERSDPGGSEAFEAFMKLELRSQAPVCPIIDIAGHQEAYVSRRI